MDLIASLSGWLPFRRPDRARIVARCYPPEPDEEEPEPVLDDLGTWHIPQPDGSWIESTDPPPPAGPDPAPTPVGAAPAVAPAPRPDGVDVVLSIVAAVALGAPGTWAAGEAR